MIACLVYVAAILVSNNELEVSKFFSFLAAMMLAYQPVRSLATLNITIQQGLAGAKRVLPVIDEKPEIKDKENIKNLEFNRGEIIFENVNFNLPSRLNILFWLSWFRDKVTFIISEVA